MGDRLQWPKIIGNMAKRRIANQIGTETETRVWERDQGKKIIKTKNTAGTNKRKTKVAKLCLKYANKIVWNTLVNGTVKAKMVNE